MLNEFIQWSDEQISHCQSLQQMLHADDRTDEARFMQIRANVYGIFRSIWAALQGDAAAVLSKLESITAAWAQSLALASTHGDMEKVHIERIKLDTATIIRARLGSMEENQ